MGLNILRVDIDPLTITGIGGFFCEFFTNELASLALAVQV
jgi:hypothetical protein